MNDRRSPDEELINRRGEFKAVLAMSIPMVISTCSPMVMRVADFAFVSALGTAAQAAIIPAQIALWCYIAMSIGLVSAVNTFAAQCLGRNRLRDCSAYAWQSLHMSAALGIAGLGLAFVYPAIFAWIGHEPDVQSLEVAYTRIGVWAILPTVAAQALGAFFNGVHRPKVTMLAAMESNALNIFLNYALIFGAFGFPRMGFAGAAMGTVLAGFYQVMRMLITLWWGEPRLKYQSRETWRIDWSKIRGLWDVGAPQGLNWLSDVTVWGIFSVLLIGRFGTIELAATNVAWQFIRIGFMPMIGVGQAITSMVGRAIGAADPQRARRVARIGVILSFSYVGALSLLYLLERQRLIELFSTDARVIALGVKIMYCVALFQLFDVLGQVYYHALRGAGDTKWSMVMLVASHWLVVIGGGYAVVTLKPEWGSMGPWVVATVLISFTGLLMWWRWRSRAWMKIDLFGHLNQPGSAAQTGAGPPIGTPEMATELSKS